MYDKALYNIWTLMNRYQNKGCPNKSIPRVMIF